ncbi:hypothetical protein C5Y96_06590 [Blastopirellula marina]|uniref:Uncharacterized protein n=1 Tax=Blastopirellula marina TaxID=124 RepID=A0A2S8FXD7_9BACT|nr:MULTISPECIES: hypothetical protein [Pirellulaceae]PQO36829.1 hypothetical protein C5Y96_06590 [Blastopirellula marina]RCS53544.1 hypothetical protein DTL36_06600 [Bremerella cremea]
MPIDFDCAVCKHRIRVPDGAEGKRTKCPKCSAIQPVPSESDELQLKDSPAEVEPPRRPSVRDAFQPTKPEPTKPAKSSFSDFDSNEAENPYAPTYGEDAVKVSSEHMEAMEKIQTPALICLILAGLGIASNLVTLVISAIGIIGEGARGTDVVIQLAMYAIGFGFAIGLLGFASFGLMQARDLKSYGLAWAGFIITLLPCSCLFPLSLPISIWGMMVLSDNSVQRQFNS